MRYIAIIGLLLSSACATAYHPYDRFRGGYLQEDVGAGIYIIKFKGNDYTSMNQAVNGAYIRANELAAEQNKRVVEAHLETYVEKHVQYKHIDSEACKMMASAGIKEENVAQDPCLMKSFEFNWPVAVLTIVLE